MVVLSRLVILNPQLHRQAQALSYLRKAGFSSLSCPLNSHLFTSLSLLNQRLKIVSCCLSSSSMEAPPEGYRRNVGICLMNSSNKIFSASRIDIPEAWQMPQGGIDQGEDPRAAAIRELREETGVSSAEVLAEACAHPKWPESLDSHIVSPEVPYWLTYDFPPAVREKLNKQWGSDWKGQAQKWFLFRFTGNDEEINLLGDGTEKPEFAEWSWMTPEQVVELAVEFKKPVYKEVLKVFTPHLQSDSAEPKL